MKGSGLGVRSGGNLMTDASQRSFGFGAVESFCLHVVLAS